MSSLVKEIYLVDIDKFKRNIKNEHMFTVLESTDCQEAFSKFHSIFCKTVSF